MPNARALIYISNSLNIFFTHFAGTFIKCKFFNFLFEYVQRFNTFHILLIQKPQLTGPIHLILFRPKWVVFTLKMLKLAFCTMFFTITIYVYILYLAISSIIIHVFDNEQGRIQDKRRAGDMNSEAGHFMSFQSFMRHFRGK